MAEAQSGKMESIVLRVRGMHCAACALLINKLLAKQLGVSQVEASFGAERVKLTYDPSKISLPQMDEFLHKLGYDLVRPEEEVDTEAIEKHRKKEQIAAKRRVILAFIISTPIIVYYMSVHIFNLRHVHEVFGIDLNFIYWVMSTWVQFGVGWPFYRNAWSAVRAGSANMDVLVVLGTTAAYLYSMIGFIFFNLDHPYWESSAALMSFILLGRFLEIRARARASDAVKKLIKLEAKDAIVIRDGQEVKVPIDQVKVGEIVVVKPGQKVPVDGTIIEGESAFDEKVVTGESMPVNKKVGDKVIGATVNSYGLIKFKAEKVGKDTLLYQIVRMVEDAQATKAPIQGLADKIAEYFVPFIILLAVVVFIGWFYVADFPFRAALNRSIAVLVISCPCALGLATPMALIVGIGKSAEYGILAKGGEAIERAKNLTTIAFDKTGTLTKGQPDVTNFVTVGSMPEDHLLPLIGAVEKGSEHPLAQAVVKYAASKNSNFPEIKNSQAVAGMGAVANIGSDQIVIGNDAMMNKYNIDHSAFGNKVETLANEAKTVIFAAVNGKVEAIIAMADTLKPFAAEAIVALKKMKIEMVMITGDNQKTAEAIARTVGIDRVMAKVLPEQKASVVKQLQSEGKKVAMVGDGINDSPALAQADVGIAIGSGTDVAIETGSYVLIKDDLRDVVTGIQLARKTIWKVKQNLFWAFVYNIVAIPIAAGALVSFEWVPEIISSLRPEVAGFAMAFSSVSVVLSASMLKLYKPPMEKLQEAENNAK
ncbi:MAG TPA: heavy metal translocating P-type ATPase [Verrucomicrobiae bacterium]|nr:heavy metal translocating P-type ATPase [Verrucomicrobiae bacterium]